MIYAKSEVKELKNQITNLLFKTKYSGGKWDTNPGTNYVLNKQPDENVMAYRITYPSKVKGVKNFEFVVSIYGGEVKAKKGFIFKKEVVVGTTYFISSMLNINTESNVNNNKLSLAYTEARKDKMEKSNYTVSPINDAIHFFPTNSGKADVNDRNALSKISSLINELSELEKDFINFACGK